MYNCMVAMARSSLYRSVDGDMKDVTRPDRSAYTCGLTKLWYSVISIYRSSNPGALGEIRMWDYMRMPERTQNDMVHTGRFAGHFCFTGSLGNKAYEALRAGTQRRVQSAKVLLPR